MGVPQSSKCHAYWEVDARKKGEVSRIAFAVVAPRASSEKVPKRMVVK